jgi:hypothetical protein
MNPNEKARRDMTRKQIKTKSTVSRPVVIPEKDPLAYEMWLIGEVEHGPVEERGAEEASYLKSFNVEDPRSGREARS